MIIAELRDVTKRFGTITAIHGVDLQVRSGELLALLGPNGAGKTTAVKLLLGLLKPSSGKVEIIARNHMGAMLQVAKVPETLRVEEHIELFSSYYPSPLPMKQVIAAAGLAGLEHRLFGELSGGQRQRVLFALAICGAPDLLFLDEPTAGLDAEARRVLWEHIRSFVARGGSVLLTTHYLEEADALADRILVINRGRIIASGTPAEIKARSAAKRIRCSTQLDPISLKAIDGVSGVNRNHRGFEILTSHAELVLRELLARDTTISDLEVSSSSLEEAFLAITKDDDTTLEVLQ
jgi:ABC-2 type transport system ATP-binding protein